MTDEERRFRWLRGEERFYAPGITDAQVRNLEMRGRAEQAIRREMRMNGASADEIDEFIAASLPSIWDVVKANTPKASDH